MLCCSDVLIWWFVLIGYIVEINRCVCIYFGNIDIYIYKCYILDI